MKDRMLDEIKLLEPEMCQGCCFVSIAIVENSAGNMVRKTYCRRGDCDNWGDIDSAEPVRLVRIYGGEGSSDPN